MTRALTAAGSAVIIKVKKARPCANTRYSPRNGYNDGYFFVTFCNKTTRTMSNNNVMFVSLMGITPVSYRFGGFFHRLP